MTELVAVPGGNRWRVGETEFVYGFRGQSTENRLLIQKTPDLITIDLHWIAVRRGPAELDPAAFRVDDHRSDAWVWTSP